MWGFGACYDEPTKPLGRCDLLDFLSAAPTGRAVAVARHHDDVRRRLTAALEEAGVSSVLAQNTRGATPGGSHSHVRVNSLTATKPLDEGLEKRLLRVVLCEEVHQDLATHPVRP
jgi:hypothetical protein